MRKLSTASVSFRERSPPPSMTNSDAISSSLVWIDCAVSMLMIYLWLLCVFIDVHTYLQRVRLMVRRKRILRKINKKARKNAAPYSEHIFTLVLLRLSLINADTRKTTACRNYAISDSVPGWLSLHRPWRLECYAVRYSPYQDYHRFHRLSA